MSTELIGAMAGIELAFMQQAIIHEGKEGAENVFAAQFCHSMAARIRSIISGLPSSNMGESHE